MPLRLADGPRAGRCGREEANGRPGRVSPTFVRDDARGGAGDTGKARYETGTMRAGVPIFRETKQDGNWNPRWRYRQ